MAAFYVPTGEDRGRFAGMDVCVLTPCGGYDVSAKFARCVGNMIAYSWLHGLRVYQWGITERTVVDWARNDLARMVKDRINEYTGRKFTHVLWLDDDHVFNPDLAVWLAGNVGDKDMLSALYYGRADQHLPVVYVQQAGQADQFLHFPLVVVPEAVVEVDAVGFGALLMRRDVLDRVPQPWFTLDYRAGEDIAFCVTARKHGVRVWVDGRYRLGHIGPPTIVTHTTYQRYMEENKERFADKVKVTLAKGG